MNLLLLLAAAGCAPSIDNAPDISEDGLSETGASAARVIVGFHGASHDGFALRAGQAVKIRDFAAAGAGVFQLPAGADVDQAIEELRSSGRFAYVERDHLRTISSVNDPYRAYQWNLDVLEAETAWETSDGSGVLVAVIDTGVSSGASDGIAAMVEGYDFVNEDSSALDDNGHGTHVAGTIAQATDNGRGVAGLAWGATILPIKVMNAAGSGYTSDIIAGIEFAIEQGADVINLSVGSTHSSTAEEAAIQAAWDAGIFVAAATGNDGASSVNYPAGYEAAVAVGATRLDDRITGYSNTGAGVELVAPGGDLTTDLDGDGYPDGILQETFAGPSWGYYFYEGTSMAAPHVAAAAALLMSAGATHEEAREALNATAVDLGGAGWDSSYGHGRIDLVAALEAVVNGPGEPGDHAQLGPQIHDVSSQRIGTFRFLITWGTDLASDSQACVVGTERCSPLRGEMVTEHRVQLNARPGTEIEVISTDEDGNTTVSEPHAL